MKRTDLPSRFQDLLRHSPYVTIATACTDGQPWNSPVVGKFDENMNLYWVSWRNNQHSRNIACEPRIFVVVYDSQVPEGQGEGLYLQMHAHALESQEELVEARHIYDASFFEHDFTHNQFADSCPQRIYKALPENIWYNIDSTSKGHFVDKRQLLTGHSR